jgi:hypothetical protein
MRLGATLISGGVELYSTGVCYCFVIGLQAIVDDDK